jgi:hypothetical protein
LVGGDWQVFFDERVGKAGLADPGLMGLKYLAVMPETKENSEYIRDGAEINS